MHLAADDRAEVFIPSRPTLLGPPLRAPEALTKLFAHSKPGSQSLRDLKPSGREEMPGLWHRVAVTAWHSVPCWAVAEADRTLGPAGSAVQHCQTTETRCLSMRPLDTLQSCPTLSLNPAHALFSRVVLEFRLGRWQGGLSRLGPFCGGRVRAWYALGSSLAMTVLGPGPGAQHHGIPQ